MNIEDIELTVRSHCGLQKAGITTVEDLVKLDWKQLTSIKNIGKKSVTEICWHCIQLLNGRLKEQRIDWDKRWPSRPDNWKELREKAVKYDEIVNIVDT